MFGPAPWIKKTLKQHAQKPVVWRLNGEENLQNDCDIKVPNVPVFENIALHVSGKTTGKL